MTTPTTPTDAMVEAGHQASMLSSAAGKDHIRDILRAALQHQEPAATPPAPSALDRAVEAGNTKGEGPANPEALMTDGEKTARAEGFCDGFMVGLVALTAMNLKQYDRWDQLMDKYFATKALIPVQPEGRREVTSSVVPKDHAERHRWMSALLRASIAYQVRTMRLGRGWTQEGLAERSGLSFATISRIEDPTGPTMSLLSLQSIAVAFDCALICQYTSWDDFVSSMCGIAPLGGYDQEEMDRLANAPTPKTKGE